MKDEDYKRWVRLNLPHARTVAQRIGRSLEAEEYRPVAERAVQLGFGHLFLQPEPFRPDEHLVPDFRKREPFRWKGGA